MGKRKRTPVPGDASTDRGPVWPLVVVWLPLIALTVSMLGPVRALAWHLLLVPGHGLLFLARRFLPGVRLGMVFVVGWVGALVAFWNWGPDEAKYGVGAAFLTACVVRAIWGPRRRGLSPSLEELTRSRLVEGLILLSRPADEQVPALSSETEVGGALLAFVLGPFHLLRDHSAKPVGEVFNLLNEMEAVIAAQPDGFRTESSVRESPQWEELRVLARTALDKLGVERTAPDLAFLREARLRSQKAESFEAWFVAPSKVVYSEQGGRRLSIYSEFQHGGEYGLAIFLNREQRWEGGAEISAEDRAMVKERVQKKLGGRIDWLDF